MRSLLVFLLAAPAFAADPPLAPVVAKLTLGTKSSANDVCWLPETDMLATATGDGSIRIWNWAKQTEIAVMPRSDTASFSSRVQLVRNRDGQRLATLEGRHTVRVWNRVTNTVTTFPVEKLSPPAKSISQVSFSSDGESLLVLIDRADLVTIPLDSKIAKPVASMPTQFGRGEKALIRDDAVVSLTAKLGAAFYEGDEIDELRVWDFATNSLRAKLRLGENVALRPLAISPTGRIVVATDFHQSKIRNLRFFDTATLVEVGEITSPKTLPLYLKPQFSADGRLLAIETEHTPTQIVIYDIAKRFPLATLSEHGRVTTLAFSLDDHRIATIGADSRIFIHDLRAAVDPVPPKVLDASACWNDLVAADGTAAMRAVYRLADHPADAVKLFRDKLKPAAKPAADDVAKWLKAMSAPAFADRQAATKKLAAAADTIEPELKAEAAKSASPETAEAIGTMLETVARSRRKLEGEYLRAYRVVQVLEMLGPPGAALLTEYAGGAKGAFLTQEAEAAHGQGK